MAGSKPQFQWDDPFFLDAQLTDEERMVRDAASAFAEDVLMPRVIKDFREESFDPAVMREMGQLGLLGLLASAYQGAVGDHVKHHRLPLHGRGRLLGQLGPLALLAGAYQGAVDDHVEQHHMPPHGRGRLLGIKRRQGEGIVLLGLVERAHGRGKVPSLLVEAAERRVALCEHDRVDVGLARLQL